MKNTKTKEIKLKTKEFLADRKNANNLVDIIALFEVRMMDKRSYSSGFLVQVLISPLLVTRMESRSLQQIVISHFTSHSHLTLDVPLFIGFNTFEAFPHKQSG